MGKIELKFHTIVATIVVVVATRLPKKKGISPTTSELFVRSSVNSRLTFTRESLTFSRKIRRRRRRRRVVRVVRARSRHETRKESLLLALARLFKN